MAAENSGGAAPNRIVKVGGFFSAGVGLKYREVAVESEEGLVWFWIGAHAEYDKLIRQRSLRKE